MGQDVEQVVVGFDGGQKRWLHGRIQNGGFRYARRHWAGSGTSQGHGVENDAIEASLVAFLRAG